jgi:protein-disulfide isomerase
MSKESSKPKAAPKNPQNPPRPASRAAERRKESERTGTRTVERRKARERERRRQQLITGGIIIVALVVIAVILVFVVNAPADAPIPDGALTRYDGIAQTRTTEGYPRLGDANAPVQVAEYSSFDCPHCRDFHDQSIDPILDRVRTGAVAFTFVPLYGTGSFANGQGAAAAALCAADQNLFWPFHDALFYWQGQFGNQAFTNNRISSGVDAFKLDRGAYNGCVGGGAVTDILNRARSQAAALLNYTGTPTITINGVVPLDQNQQPLNDANSILARIDEEIARSPVVPTPATPASATTPEATVTATEAVSAVTVEPTAEATTEPTAEATPAS